MHRSIQGVALVAALCFTIPAGSSSASAIVPAQLTGPATQVADVPKTVAPKPEDKSLPGEPVAIEAQVGRERTSEALIVLLGAFLGVVGIAGFYYLGQRMHPQHKAKEQIEQN